MSFFLMLVSVFVFLFSNVYAKKGYGPGEQDWGFLESQKGVHMFYWLFYTTANVKNYTERPLVIWLQGGPGHSDSGHANFAYFGPLDLDGNEREYAWPKYVNLLLVDNPVGTGYSYVDNLELLPHKNTEIALNLVEFMKGFYEKHPEFLTQPLYLFCESYGCKFGVEFALEMWRARANDSSKLAKIKSVHIGNPWIAPKAQNNFIAKVAYSWGIVDEDDRDIMQKQLDYCNKLIDEGDNLKAWLELVKLKIDVCQRTAGIDIFNGMKPVKRSAAYNCFDFNDPLDGPLFLKMNFEVKMALKIPLFVIWNIQRLIMFQSLSADILESGVPIVEQLLNETDIDVNLISGNTDLLCSTTVSLSWISELNWPRRSEYLNASRKPFYVDNVLEGFEKSGGGFMMTWILRAGHLFVEDNPKAMAYLLQKYTGILN